ncbi:MAG: sugar-binding transcriptional regulator [Filifactoraceae bacterium]
MLDLIKIQAKVVPDVLEEMLKRYRILHEISVNEVIGRRLLAAKIGLTERVVRSEIEFLKNLNLLEVTSSGMSVTEYGSYALSELEDFVSSINGMDSLEKKLKDILKIKDVIVVSHNCDIDRNGIKFLAKAASNYFLKTLEDVKVLGVTGGSTMISFSKAVPQSKIENDLYVIPARGALGERLENQANNVASNLAKQLNAKYDLLHMTDTVNENLKDQILLDPNFANIMNKIDTIEYLVFGIGDAEIMATKRNSSEKQLELIKNKTAVAEAFGHYFNIDGDIVLETPTLGIKLEHYKKLNHCLAVAAGRKKSAAILAISKINKNLVLVIDESAAFGILELVEKN